MTLAEIVAALAEPGWCVVPDYLSATETANLRDECLAAQNHGDFHPAGVGRGVAEVRSEIRGDQVLWVDEALAGPALKNTLARLETLRLAVNQHLFLGLFDVELHFAIYPPGAGYRRHLDRFQDDDRRTLTIILYLNENWTDADGGLLHFWPDASENILEIEPAGGTLVTFLSDRFWHEVAPARKTRLSLTGWFRRR
jgi:SM-20-related protein